MSDYLRSVLRTVVPAVWATLLALAASWGLPAGVLPEVVPPAVWGYLDTAVVPVILAVVYGAVRAVEGRLPDVLARVLLGSAHPPGYGQDLDASDGTVTIGGVTYTAGPPTAPVLVGSGPSDVAARVTRSRAFPDEDRPRR